MKIPKQVRDRMEILHSVLRRRPTVRRVGVWDGLYCAVKSYGKVRRAGVPPARITVIPNAVLKAANNQGGTPSVTINFNGPVSNKEEVHRSAAQAGAQLARMVAMGKRGI